MPLPLDSASPPWAKAGAGCSGNLAPRLDATREIIDYYERRAVNPSLTFIERAAEALEVTVAELVGAMPDRSARPGPQLARRIEQIRCPPKRAGVRDPIPRYRPRKSRQSLSSLPGERQ